MSWNTKVYKEHGGGRMVVASGGSFDVESGGEIDIESGGSLKIGGTAVTATAAEINAIAGAQEYQLGVAGAKVGGTAGWVVNAAADIPQATMAASQTAGTLVLPVSGLKVGWTITGFKIAAQIESVGAAVTLDADLRKQTNAAADPTDASVGAITQVSVTAQTASAAAKTGLTEVVAADEWFYILFTGTTAASTDIRLLGATVTVTEG